jgi:TolB-like protein/tetratricopeptide (TPR) repeat protein
MRLRGEIRKANGSEEQWNSRELKPFPVAAGSGVCMSDTLEVEQSKRDSRSASLAPIGPDEIREELNRILFSQTFRAAEREKAFLRYVVERTIEGRSAQLKEYTIGVEAFERGDEFDPRRDTIVRTEARNVRRRLTRYYDEEGHGDPVRIELPKGGYSPQFVEPPRLEAEPVVRVPAKVPEAPAPAVAESPARAPGLSFQLVRIKRQLKRWWVVGLAGAATIGAIAALWAHAPSFNRPKPVDAASIAVLPFQDLSSGQDREGEILSDGLTGELIESLARIPHLRVVARSSAFAYQGRTVDIRKAGREMGVRNILEGSIRISNGRVRIVAQLEDTTNGYQLWSQSFDRKFDDVLAVQDQISTAIMQSLGVQLTGAANLKTGASTSPVAYQDFLQGLYFLNQSTAENIRTSIHYFDRAVASDPGFAPAYSELAAGYAAIAGFTSTPSQEVVPRIRAAALKALQLDDTQGEAHLFLARADTYEENWAEAGKEYWRALELSPGSAAVHRYYGDYLLRTGRLEQALAEGRIALELDPLSPPVARFVGEMLYYLGRYDDSVAQLQKALALNPTSGILHQELGLVYMNRPATYKEGIAECERARDLMEGDPWTTSQLGYAYALVGRTAEARDILRKLEAGSQDHVRALAVARVYAGLGDRDQAIAWLEKAIQQHDVNLYIASDPVYAPLHADPRFHTLLERAESGRAAQVPAP